MEDRPDSPEQPTNSSYGRLFDAASPAPVATPPGQWEPPLPDEVAAMLPGYAVTGILGRGGMGAVYRGTQASLDRPVAIKLLPPELGADPEFEARFRREAKAMARLNHPNIVQIYDFGTTAGGHHYFVMEYVDGTDLHRLIHGGGLDATGALNAVSQICDALEYAHGEGFVHRDIKPANIFVNSKGILKVGDFGLAKLVDGAAAAGRPSSTELMGLTMTGMAMGTPHYVAPEQMAATGAVDHRADLYSLGVMFYEMLTGEIPRGAVKPPSQKVKALDMRLDDVVFRAMEVDPAERYQSATDLRTDVDGIRLNPAPVV
ncbi:MAG: serine/threonine protein kinase, partial [Verrucomicrobiae bacterium]|nr:serine/threonine protein kinase [Verrucomicrobiae bacterium]